MENPNNELVFVMSERQGMYRFLARIFHSEVDCELLSEISQMDLSTRSGVQEIDKGFQMLDAFMRKVNETTLIDLAAEYARLFLGAGSKQIGCAFPFESVYTSPRGLLMQEARDQVVDIYRQSGIQRSSEFHDLEDHIALELEFIAFLSEKTGQAVEEQVENSLETLLQKQQEFLDKHLCNWVPRFCSDVIHCASLDFYKAIASITTGYITLDHSLIADLLATSVVQVA